MSKKQDVKKARGAKLIHRFKTCLICGNNFMTRNDAQTCCGVECAGELKAATQTTICSMCVNASGGCSWSLSYTPVDGWEAKPTKIKNKDGERITYLDSYKVIKCPEFMSRTGRRLEEIIDVEDGKNEH